MKKRLKILNIWVDPVSMTEAISVVKGFIRSNNGPHLILAANPEKNFTVPRDPELFEAFRSADLLIPDGIGMVLAARVLYGVKINRVPGVDLMHEICNLAAREGDEVFIYGSKEEVNRRAIDTLMEIYPGLKVAGRANGYVPNEEMGRLVKAINDSRAKILFVGLGSPKQEKWLASYRNDLKHVKVCQGIGGTLDTIAGTVRRAPEPWRRVHAEWLYRLLREPKRIKRQRVLPLFALGLLIEKLRR